LISAGVHPQGCRFLQRSTAAPHGPTMRVAAAHCRWMPVPPGRARPLLVRPLLVTADPDLLDDVLRLCAAAGVDIEVAPDPTAARPAWARAPLVLVGDDVSVAMSRVPLPRRADVILVGRDLGGGTGSSRGSGGNGGSAGNIWERACGVGAEHVAVFPDAEPWLIARLADAVDSGVALGLTIAVVGGRGGAGASTLAAALAVTAMRGRRRAMLIDADPYGGGADLLFGGERAAGLRWPDVATANGRIAGDELVNALPRMGELAVLSCDRGDPLELGADAMSSVLAAAARVCEVVVVDLPRRIGESAQVALAASNLALIVVPAEIRAAAAAARVATEVARFADDVRLVVRGPAPGGLDAIDIASALGLPLAGQLKAEPDLAVALERGEVPAGQGRGPLAEFCRRLLASTTVADEPILDPIGGGATWWER
jgi:secretion/DNA translocation related CpaE-like protein